jgi:hypothetical protein
MVKVSEPEKSLALGIESETDEESTINEIDEMKFDPKITSTDKKTGDRSDSKINDEEILKLKITTPTTLLFKSLKVKIFQIYEK